MLEDLEFIREIQSQPDDDTPRLIFADYLEDRGDPRGEFIRVQCELAALEAGAPRAPALRTREAELLDEHAESWLAPLRKLGARGLSRTCFRRGLIERVELTVEAFVRNIEALCEREPALRAVELRNVASTADELRAARFPPQIRELNLAANKLSAGQLSTMARGVWTTQILELDISYNLPGDSGLTALLQGDWTSLTSLVMNRVGVTQGLVGLPGLLETFRPQRWLAGGNLLTEGALRGLFASPLASALTELDLSACKLSPNHVAALLESDSLVHLRRLILRGNPGIRPAMAMLTTTPPRLPSLEHLDLRGSDQPVPGHQGVAEQEPVFMKMLAARLGAGLMK